MERKLLLLLGIELQPSNPKVKLTLHWVLGSIVTLHISNNSSPLLHMGCVADTSEIG
jgi:hypothetical protein